MRRTRVCQCGPALGRAGRAPPRRQASWYSSTTTPPRTAWRDSGFSVSGARVVPTGWRPGRTSRIALLAAAGPRERGCLRTRTLRTGKTPSSASGKLGVGRVDPPSPSERLSQSASQTSSLSSSSRLGQASTRSSVRTSVRRFGITVHWGMEGLPFLPRACRWQTTGSFPCAEYEYADSLVRVGQQRPTARS